MPLTPKMLLVSSPMGFSHVSRYVPALPCSFNKPLWVRPSQLLSAATRVISSVALAGWHRILDPRYDLTIEFS
jgi:hypothetical protein